MTQSNVETAKYGNNPTWFISSIVRMLGDKTQKLQQNIQGVSINEWKKLYNMLQLDDLILSIF